MSRLLSSLKQGSGGCGDTPLSSNFFSNSVAGADRASLAVGLSLLALLMIPGSTGPAIAQGAEVVVVDVRAVAEGYRMSELTGQTVKNSQNQDIGTIDDFIVSKADRSLYAILAIGGFLGIGERLVAVAYESLSINEDGTEIVLAGATSESLSRLPAFTYVD